LNIIDKFRNIKANQGVMKYLTNTSWLFGEKILRMTLGLFVGIWVARYLGPEQFGLFSYVQSIIAIFAVITTLGLDAIVVKVLVSKKQQENAILGTAFTLKLLGAITLLCILSIIMFIYPEDYQTTLLFLIIASGTIFQSFNVIDFYFQSKVLSKYVVYVNTFSLLVSSILKVVLILNNATLVSFAYVVLFDSVVLGCGFIYFYRLKAHSIFFWRIDKFIAKSLLKDSWPLILSGLFVSMYMKIDQVMIKNMMTSADLGQYAAAVRLSEVWYFIPIVISSSLFPAILNARKVSKEQYYSRIQKLYDLMAWMAIIIAIPMTFLSDWLVVILYGNEFSQAGSVLMIHIWSAVFVFLGVASSKWFLAEGLQIFSLYRTLIGVFTNITLNLILIPIYGISGAAVATLISQLLASYLFNVINKKSRITFILQTKALFLPFRLLGAKS
jgi:O-antigen/teichoic acid export membrane protein